MIRVDFVDFYGNDADGKKKKAEIEEALGPISSQGNMRLTHAPYGSEGSLKWKIMETKGSYINRFNIAIWGDLRDYGEEESDIDKIKRWFQNVCRECGMVRDAVLHIHVEFKEGITLLYHDHNTDESYKETTENLCRHDEDD
jgi:hypothetical protein